ncbi:hypothetical protein RI367_005434 [Sorochytrium milnesiophthora]
MLCSAAWLRAVVGLSVFIAAASAQAPLNGKHTRAFVDLPQTNITFLGHSGATVFGVTFYNGAKAAAKLLKFPMFGATPDPSLTVNLLTQVVRMNDAFNNNTGAIVATIPDPSIVGVPLHAVAAAGMPVWAANSGYDVASSLGVINYVGQNETGAGYLVGKTMLANNRTTPICVLPDLQNTAINSRCTGLFAAFNERLGTNYSLSPGSPAVALTGSIYQYANLSVTTITNFLNAHPNIDCIMSATTSVLSTVLTALNNTQSRIVAPYHACVDFNLGMAANLQAGYIQMAVNQNVYLQSFLTVMYALPYLMVNETVSSPVVTSGPVGVTMANLAAQNATNAMAGVTQLNVTGRRAYVILHTNALLATDSGMVRGLSDMAHLSGYNLTFAPRTTEYSLSTYTALVTNALAGCASNSTTCPHALIVSNAEPALVNFARNSAATASIPLFVIGASGALADMSSTFYVGADDFAMGVSAANTLAAAGVRKPLCLLHDQVAATLPNRCAGAASVYPNMPAALWIDGFDTSAVNFSLSSAVTADIDGFICASEAACDGTIYYATKVATRRMPIVSIGHNTNTLISMALGVVIAVIDLQPYAVGFLTLGHVIAQLDTLNQVEARPLQVGGTVRTYACPRGYMVNPDYALPLYQTMPSGISGFGKLCQPCPAGTYAAVDNAMQCLAPPTGYYVYGPPGQSSYAPCNDGIGITQAQCASYFALQEVPTSAGVVVALYVFAGILMAGIVAVMVLIWLYRATPTLKRASPVFCELICLGGLLGCGSVFFMFGTTTAGCMAFICLLCFSYAMTLGSLIFKNYRLYKIFNTFRKNYKFSDGQLAKYVVAVVLVEIAIVAAWAGVDAPSHQLFRNAISTYGVCASANPTHQAIFQSLLIVYNGLLLVGGLVLAVKSRGLTAEFAESKYIGLSCYQITLCALLGLAVASTPSMDISFRNAIVGFAILVGFSGTIFVMFGQRLLQVIREKRDNDAEQLKSGPINSTLILQRTSAMTQSAGAKTGPVMVSFKGLGMLAAFERRVAELTKNEAGTFYVHVNAPSGNALGVSFCVGPGAYKWRKGPSEGSLEFYRGRHVLAMQFAQDTDLASWLARLPAHQDSKPGTQVQSAKKGLSSIGELDSVRKT